MTSASASVSSSAYRKISDWSVNPSFQSAEHKTGLVIRLERSSKNRKAFIDIQGIQKLSGTEWAAQVNVLVEQGISLIETGVR